MLNATIGPTATRDAILIAAEAEFGRLGYRTTTIGGIAEAAGVSRPLVYRYFDDKETLYRLVVERMLLDWNESLVDVASQAAPTTAHTLRAVMAACLDWGRSRAMLRGVLLRDADITSLVAGDTLAEGRARLPALLARVLAEGAARGDVRTDLDVREMASVLAEVIVAGSLQALAHADRPVDHMRVDTMVEVVLHGVILPPH